MFLATLRMAASMAMLSNISNVKPRTDVLGQLMDIHDGNVIKVNSTAEDANSESLYYWYGMGYLNCTETVGLIPPFDCPGIYKPFGQCGFREDHPVNLYTSPDLVSWTFRGNVFATRPEGIYFRPKVIYNAGTSKYVLWINRLAPAKNPLAAYPNATYLVATADHPAGSVTLHTRSTNLDVLEASDGVARHAIRPFSTATLAAATVGTGGGDFALFVDDKNGHSGDAYIAYDAWSNNHKVGIEQLTPDYLNSRGAAVATGTISPAGYEAPIIFERKGWYYLLFGPTCCFCSPGSGSEVWTARSMLGPWNYSGVDINPEHGLSGKDEATYQRYLEVVVIYADVFLTGDAVITYIGRTIKAQENYVITVPHADGTADYIYTGDRWCSAPDKLKSHDFQYWEPLLFDDRKVPPMIAPLTFKDSFTINAQ